MADTLFPAAPKSEADDGDRGLQGYVADEAYPAQHHPDLDPTRQAATLLAMGRAHRAPGNPMRYLELGCGPGFSLAAFAAAQPDSEFIGVDINPVHIDALSSLAQAGGLSNVRAVCSGFDGLDVARLGTVQTAAAHGVWSWVSAASRRSVVDLLDRVLDDGGVFYLSYNCLPGMAAIEPLRTLLLLSSDQAGPTSRRVEQAVAFVRQAAAAGSSYLEGEAVRPRLEALLSEAPGYLAHEYFNRDWTSFYHAEVAEALSPAGLVFSAASRLPDNLDRARFTAEQRLLLDQLGEGSRRETLKDFMSNRTFRADLFVRGNRRISPRALAQKLGSARLVCVCRPEDSPSDAPPRYARLIAALSEGPATLGELQAGPGIGGAFSAELVREAVVELMAMEIVALCLPRAGEREREASTARFNAAVLDRARKGDILPGLVSPVTGGVFALAAEELIALARGDVRSSPGLAAVLRRLRIML